MAFINWNKCLSEPKHLLRLIVIIICVCIASYQLSGCVKKMIHPPISTHYMFKLNESMQYPSITLCRNPPYKSDILEKYGLPPASLHLSSTWKSFKFDKYTLDEFFEEVTFNFSEVVAMYGFDGYRENLNIIGFLKLRHGLCFKLTPKHISTVLDDTSGYVLSMHHNVNIRNNMTFRASMAGYHVYIHEDNEMITDQSSQAESFMEYIYAEAGEDLRYSMRTNEYNQLPGKDNNCISDRNYSKSRCREMCMANHITKEVGCSTPWMENQDLPRCSNYQDVKAIIMAYNTYSKKDYRYLCQCHRSCNITIYFPYVQNRKEIELPNSILSLYYSSNLVTAMEEIVGYDWNLFLSDLGGSLGFLLGLSVLGIIGVLEQILELCIRKKNTVVEELNKVDEPAKMVEIYLNGKKIDDLDMKNANVKNYIDYFGDEGYFEKNEKY